MSRARLLRTTIPRRRSCSDNGETVSKGHSPTCRKVSVSCPLSIGTYQNPMRLVPAPRCRAHVRVRPPRRRPPRRSCGAQLASGRSAVTTPYRPWSPRPWPQPGYAARIPPCNGRLRHIHAADAGRRRPRVPHRRLQHPRQPGLHANLNGQDSRAHPRRGLLLHNPAQLTGTSPSTGRATPRGLHFRIGSTLTTRAVAVVSSTAGADPCNGVCR